MSEKDTPNFRLRLWKLFLSTLYLSAFTFGGGYVIVTLMKKKFVDEYHWIGEDEMLDLVAIAQSSPGAIAVNGAIVVGYKLAGIPGTLVAILSVNRLGQILRHPQFDGFLRVFKFLITGQNDDLDVRKLSADQSAELQPVHKRHPDISDHDIRKQPLDHGIGQFSVTGLPTELIAMSLPVDIIFDSLADDEFILHQKHF